MLGDRSSKTQNYHNQSTSALAPPPSPTEPTTAHHGSRVAISAWWTAVAPVSSAVMSLFDHDQAWAVGRRAVYGAAAGTSNSKAHSWVLGNLMSFLMRELLCEEPTGLLLVDAARCGSQYLCCRLYASRGDGLDWRVYLGADDKAASLAVDQVLPR